MFFNVTKANKMNKKGNEKKKAHKYPNTSMGAES